MSIKQTRDDLEQIGEALEEVLPSGDVIDHAVVEQWERTGEPTDTARFVLVTPLIEKMLAFVNRLSMRLAGLLTSPLPSRWADRQKWITAWDIIQEAREVYKGDRTNPTYAELRDAIGYEMDWFPSERTIRKILRAGDSGVIR